MKVYYFQLFGDLPDPAGAHLWRKMIELKHSSRQMTEVKHTSGQMTEVKHTSRQETEVKHTSKQMTEVKHTSRQMTEVKHTSVNQISQCFMSVHIKVILDHLLNLNIFISLLY